jgi:hypothetical protein
VWGECAFLIQSDGLRDRFRKGLDLLSHCRDDRLAAVTIGACAGQSGSCIRRGCQRPWHRGRPMMRSPSKCPDPHDPLLQLDDPRLSPYWRWGLTYVVIPSGSEFSLGHEPQHVDI